MTGRRFWAIPGLAGIALLVVLPFGPTARAATGAAAGLTVSISSPSDGQKFSSSDIVTVSGQVATSALLANVTLIEVDYSYGGSVFHTTKACGPCGTESTVPFTVDSPPLNVNGPYTIKVRATGRVLLDNFPVDGSASRGVVLAVPPNPPTGVTATALPDRRVRLTWTAPVKPADFLGYVVYRMTDVSPFSVLGITKETSFTDDQTAQISGTVQYLVASVREGAVPGNAETALQAPAGAVVVTLPALPTTSTVPGATSTTLQPGGGNQAGGAASVDLSGLLPSPAPQLPQFPPTSPPPTLPDTGFNPILPFPTPSISAPVRVEGRQQANPAAATGAGQLDSSGGDNTNRRALLVPVAAGSVLCVTALHLRWLNRRLAVSAFGAAASTGTGTASSGGRGAQSTGVRVLEPLPPEPDTFLPDAKPVRVGAVGAPAGAGSGSGSRPGVAAGSRFS